MFGRKWPYPLRKKTHPTLKTRLAQLLQGEINQYGYVAGRARTGGQYFRDFCAKANKTIGMQQANIVCTETTDRQVRTKLMLNKCLTTD